MNPPRYHLLKFVLVFVISIATIPALTLPPPRDYYEIRIYNLTSQTQQERVEAFLKVTYLPALHRAGIRKVGVFKPVESDTAYFGKRIYVLIPYASLDQYIQLNEKLQKDQQFQTGRSDYWDVPYDAPPYARIESVLLQAFAGSPQ